MLYNGAPFNGALYNGGLYTTYDGVFHNGEVVAIPGLSELPSPAPTGAFAKPQTMAPKPILSEVAPLEAWEIMVHHVMVQIVLLRVKKVGQKQFV